MKRYYFTSIIRGEKDKHKVFKKREDAIKYMDKLLFVYDLQVDYVEKHNRNHSCEYVCEDNRNRFLINRVIY